MTWWLFNYSRAIAYIYLNIFISYFHCSSRLCYISFYAHRSQRHGSRPVICPQNTEEIKIYIERVWKKKKIVQPFEECRQVCRIILVEKVWIVSCSRWCARRCDGMRSRRRSRRPIQYRPLSFWASLQATSFHLLLFNYFQQPYTTP